MANNVTSIPGHLVPNGYSQITSVAAAVGISPPDNSVVAFIQPESQNVRWRDDGTNPTASVGNRLFADDILIYTGDMTTLKIIQEAASAKLNITFYRNKG